MVADKVFDYPEVGYYARFPRASKICKVVIRCRPSPLPYPELTQCTAFAVPPLIANICSTAKALPTSRQRDEAADLHARSVVLFVLPKCPTTRIAIRFRFVDNASPPGKDHTVFVGFLSSYSLYGLALGALSVTHAGG